MEPPKIITAGLVIRAWQPQDAAAVERACQDPDIQRWTSVPVPYHREHADFFVAQLSPTKWRDGTGAPLGVFDERTGDLLGSTGLISITGQQAEIGYWTAPWARGKGSATAATRAVARWAIEELGVRRLVWRAEVGNHPSRLVALRSGFTMEGIARHDIEDRDSTRRDAWVGSLLPGDPTDPEIADAEVRRAKAFSRPQPDLFATTRAGEIKLRALEERDIDAITESSSDPETVRWTTVPHPYRREHAESFVRDIAPTNWRRGSGAVFAIGDPETDAYAGIMDLRLHPTRSALADVGFVVPPHARGRGFAPAALSAVCAWGFTALGVDRIGWWANVGNEASRRVAEKAGFTFEGTNRGYLDHRGELIDAWAAALLASDEPFNGRTPA
ncbi:Protein N-acetyltransferase, RimJ/RimL family [Asanoa hainanensis]|uniref:Protein N-acetyltransferase, RimJ/RimL family n=1 Tax=Asanoa hainanensis TaxID=560556 RepID=A0A239IFW9_9ACTN|nr:GNAT family N-acetyltransferase [Asanoa hainanensis]SNS92646.1 Protein N-acetyltransferase, RimJ/RimL family [Asanoa hainanensis]